MNNWYMDQDRMSVHVGINVRLGLLRKERTDPTLIRLGKKHTRLFWKECGFPDFNPRSGTEIRFGKAIWVEANNCYCYNSFKLIPMKFNDPKIYGIAVESVSKPAKKKE